MTEQRWSIRIGTVALATMLSLVLACGDGGAPSSTGAQPQQESGDATAATDSSGRGGTAPFRYFGSTAVAVFPSITSLLPDRVGNALLFTCR